MMDLEIGRNTFGAQSPFIHRKVVSRLNSDDVVLFHKEIHSALHCAVWTMRRHDFVDDAIRTPAAVRRIMQMRAVSFNNTFEVADFTHPLFSTSRTDKY